MDGVKFVEDSLKKVWSDIICLGRPYHFKFFKGCLPQILLDPFLNTLTHLWFQIYITLQDNCPNIPNNGQDNNDSDDRGDDCDGDDDNDNYSDEKVSIIHFALNVKPIPCPDVSHLYIVLFRKRSSWKKLH